MSRGTQSGSRHFNTRVYSDPTVASSIPAEIPRCAVTLRGPRCGCLHDATVTPQTARTCAPNPGAVIDRAQLIRAVCGPAEPINRPRETPPSSQCRSHLSLSLFSSSPSLAPREADEPPPAAGRHRRRSTPRRATVHRRNAPPPEQAPVSSSARMPRLSYFSIAPSMRVFLP